MTASQLHDRNARLAALPYQAADLDVTLEEMTHVVAGSGLDGAHAACVRLHRIRRALRRTVGRLSAQAPQASR